MARSGGRYTLENGKRQLISNTQPQPRKGTTKSGGLPESKTDITTDTKPATQPASTTGKAAPDKEAK